MASLIEHFRMPIREIEEKFTISEIVITSWRSQEQAFFMSNRDGKVPETNEPRPQKKSRPPEEQISQELIETLPDRFFNEEGDLDMRLMTSDEAIKFMNAAGFPVVPFF